MNNVNITEVENIANSIKSISTNLRNNYDSIYNVLSKLNNCINELESWNGADAIKEPYPYDEVPFNSGLLGEIIKKKEYYKYVWNIKNTSNNIIQEYLSSDFLKQLDENISSLDLEEKDLNILASTLFVFIITIGSILNTAYDGDIESFFSKIKDNSGWLETKKIAEESKAQKTNDELYNLYRSKDGEDDYVDFLLDEIGKRRYSSDNDAIMDDGSSEKNGTIYYNQWYMNHYKSLSEDDPLRAQSEVDYLRNDMAFCATTISYAIASTGNQDAFPPYISVATGSNNARSLANNNTGTWHDGSDNSYQPQRGDIFFMVRDNGTGHTGIVLASDDNYIYTIEGNTGSEYTNLECGTVNTRIRERSYVNNGISSSGYYTPNIQINQNDSYEKVSNETLEAKLNLSAATN